MSTVLESIFLVSAALGFLLSLALFSAIFKKNKANFFLGFIILFLSVQILFSWGSYSGYNNSPESFPFWVLLTYHVLPPSVWLFTICQIKPLVNLKRRYALLYLPAVAEISISVLFLKGIIDYPINLMEYQPWIWFIDYIPLSGFVLALGFFWVKYFEISRRDEIKPGINTWISHVTLLLLMGVLTMMALLWVIFSFIGWENFLIIEFLLVFLLFVFSFLLLLEGPTFPVMEIKVREDVFPNYNDQEELKRLKEAMDVNQVFINPDLSLNELSQELALPSRYLSYLINKYHHKSYKEFINQYRIDFFITKARSGEVKSKTLLALAMESGFNSKSTFNQAFKNCKGKSPSEFLR